MQLKPSPIDQQVLSTLQGWVTLLKSSLRLSLDHSFSSHPPSCESDAAHAQCDESPAFSANVPCDSPAYYAHDTQRVIAPAHAAHHILVKALALAHHSTILGEVVWLCKSLLPLVKPRYIKYFILYSLCY